MVKRLHPTIAEKLVVETVKQLREKGYFVHPCSLYQAIGTAKIPLQSQKMQFKLSKNEKFDQTITGPNNETFQFFPRRILLNTTTDYKPNKITTLIKKIEADYFGKKTKGFDSSYVCRCAREDPQILEIMQKAYSNGNKYSLMGTLGEMYGEDAEGRIAHDEQGEIYIRRPIIIIPGAEPEEISQLELFCKQFQIPSKKRIDRILGITD